MQKKEVEHVCRWSCGKHRPQDLRPHCPNTTWMSTYFCNYCQHFEEEKKQQEKSRRRQKYIQSEIDNRKAKEFGDFTGGAELPEASRSQMGFFGDPMKSFRQEGVKDSKRLSSAIRQQTATKMVGAGYQSGKGAGRGGGGGEAELREPRMGFDRGNFQGRLWVEYACPCCGCTPPSKTFGSTATANGVVENVVKPAFALTADDLIRVFNDPDGELRHYEFDPKEIANMELEFVMDPPFDKIKASVDKVKQDIFRNFDSKQSKMPRFEHVGSTAIKGMPGTLAPDALLIEKRFPPSPSTIRALLAAGFRFKSLAPHGKNDYWFMKPIPADELGGHRVMTLHLVDEANPTGRVILKLRDVCNKDPEAFEEYKATKLAARGGTFLEYKMRKSQSGLVQRLRKEEGMPEGFS